MAGLLTVGEMGALALHEMVELAILREKDPEARLTIQEIAEKLQASVHTLQKVTRRLIALEMIDGTRGAKGGLKLVANPDTTTMLEIMEGVDKKIRSNGCLFAHRVCPSDCACVFRGLTDGMERKIREYFTKTTLANLRDQAMRAGRGDTLVQQRGRSGSSIDAQEN